MTIRFSLRAAALLAPLAFTQSAWAAPGDPVPVGEGLTLDPIIEGRLRYEQVDQPGIEAEAVTMRLRAGVELKQASGFSFLAEGEGTLALDDHYNAFPFPIASSQRRARYATIADPMTVELNRLQIRYKGKAQALTLGRQRINLDDQRWVGSVGWRQDEQTFDAARIEAKLGPVDLDGTFATSQRTIFGSDGGPRTAYDGHFGFLGVGTRLGPVQLRAFAYLLDYDAKEQGVGLAVTNADTQTYGLRATGAFALGPGTKLNLAASYARQSDWQDNPSHYGVDYVAAEAGLAHGSLGLTAGYEKLGSHNGHALQTPMATLHKFNGWADLFLSTPAKGLQDSYGGASWKFAQVKALPGLNASITYHRFDSDAGSLHYGNEWDASLGFRLGRMNLLAKLADYDADRMGADTRKLWLQMEFTY